MSIFNFETIGYFQHDHLQQGSGINGTFENAEQKIAIHTKIMEEYLKKINSSDSHGEQSINWVTHQKCHDMFILSKVRSVHTYIHI